MATLDFALIREGDWISGTTRHDEKFIGFVQSVIDTGGLKVLVTQSDHEAIVGTTVQVRLAKVRKLFENGPTSPEEVKSMIELALGTHDKQWFEQLRAELAILSMAVTKSNDGITLTKIKGRF